MGNLEIPGRDPDYIGAWDCHVLEELQKEYLPFGKPRLPTPEENRFHLWLSGDIWEGDINGVCIDKNGPAVIHGSISTEYMGFMKWYDEKAIRGGALDRVLCYRGVREFHNIRKQRLEIISGLVTYEDSKRMRPKNFIMIRGDDRLLDIGKLHLRNEYEYPISTQQ
jgi:hypothetical protein